MKKHSPNPHRRSLPWAFVAAASLVMAVLTPVAATADVPPESPSLEADGLTEATAAASCWEVKQNNPEAPDGSYWIWTPKLEAAEQFYCDQSTDGGGWVLIGRGRDGWSESNMGSGSAEQVRTRITGSAAFKPRQLPASTIDGLLNGESINSTSDGIRLRRALDQSGSSWQNISFRLDSPRDTWTWQFYNNQRIKDWTIDGVTRSGGSTTDFGTDQAYLRVNTVARAAQGWQTGFGYGRNARGSSSSDSYVWAKDGSSGNPRPFTQVFLRPKLTSPDTSLDIPNTGTPEETQTPGARSFATTTAWGVAGLGNGPRSIEGSNEVSAFAEVGNRIFVAGNFTRIQKTASAGDAIQQSYLAAFDRDSGEFISSFRPTLNNQIKSLAAMPNGRLAMGGYFSQVNGEQRNGLAVVDASTGELDSQFSGVLVNYLSGGVPSVRSMDVQGDWLYVGGAFTHATGGAESNEVYVRAGARFNVSDGTPDGSWNPEFNGTVIDLDASEHGDRTYFAGYFGQAHGDDAMRGAAIETTAGAGVINWDVVLSSSVRAGYQQAVKEVGNRVWLGGSEHSLFSYDRAGLGLLSTAVGQRGGDFQAIASDGVTVYGGCHCFDAIYMGASHWPNVGNTWSSADRIYAAGAWNASTAAYKPDFSPELNTRAGAGAWALFVDSTGQLWEGGDFSYSTRSGYARQWSGGFVRFAPKDTTAPTKPQALQGTASASNVNLSWEFSNADASRYEVLRDDRVVASTSKKTVELPPSTANAKYFVRAVDASENKSASTAGIVLDPPTTEPEEVVLVEPESSWSYLYDAEGPESEWLEDDKVDQSWATGSAPIGWGHSNVGTTLTTTASPKPLTSFYEKSVEVADASNIAAVRVTARVDDGAIIYFNGQEVYRKNVDEGDAGINAYANAAVGATAAANNPAVVEVPGSFVHTGSNTIQVEVHSNYRATPSHSFELNAVAVNGEQPDPEDPDESEPDDPTVLSEGSEWSYYFQGAEVSEDWNLPEFDASTWESGRAPLGWGHSGLGTQLSTTETPKPVTSYYRSTFSIPEAEASEVSITTRADDGIVVFVNGVEVKRVNIDPGPYTGETFANAAVSANVAENRTIEFNLPASVFTEGVNVVAAEVHSNYRSTRSHSFEMKVEAR